MKNPWVMLLVGVLIGVVFGAQIKGLAGVKS